MTGEPDGVDVVETAAQARALRTPPLLVIEPLREFFDERGLGVGDLSWERIGEGHANLTYLIRRGPDRFVLRRGPRPPHPPSTHDMIREVRIQTLVAASDVAVPPILAVCEDPTLLGVPFYVMAYLDGVVITDEVPGALGSPQERRATGLAAVDVLADLHQLDVGEGPLSQIGRPHGYLERQVQRFWQLWEHTAQREVPAIERVRDLLAVRIPESRRASVVHGDFRLGNLMFSAEAPARVLAILDWEMATLGDPLADLGYLTATYAVPGEPANPMNLTSVTRLPGYPTRDELIDRYVQRTGADPSELSWYQGLALWKAAIFCEEIYTRWRRGESPGDDLAPTLETGVLTLADRAMAFLTETG